MVRLTLLPAIGMCWLSLYLGLVILLLFVDVAISAAVHVIRIRKNLDFNLHDFRYILLGLIF